MSWLTGTDLFPTAATVFQQQPRVLLHEQHTEAVRPARSNVLWARASALITKLVEAQNDVHAFEIAGAFAPMSFWQRESLTQQ